MDYKIPFTSFIEITIDFAKVYASIREPLLNSGLSDKELTDDAFIKSMCFSHLYGACSKPGALSNYSSYINGGLREFVEDVRRDFANWLTVSEFHHNYKPAILFRYEYAVFYRNGCTINGYGVDKIIQRDGYMKTVGETILHFNHYVENGHQSYADACKMFGFDSAYNSENLLENVNPWLCFTENQDLVLYFGEDKPVRKYKTVKVCTKHKKYWANQSNWDKPCTYYYWDVKDKSKLVVCTYSDIENSFPELQQYKIKQSWYPSFDVDKIEPFRATDEYDYTSEERAEIIRKREEEKRRREEYEAELERRKATPGYCSCCGSELADYVADPYYSDMYGETHMVWLCPSCYESRCGDI